MWSMMLVSFLFWALVAGAAAGLIWWWLVTRRPRTDREAALDTLRERYARGEISREEFDSRRHDLAA